MIAWSNDLTVRWVLGLARLGNPGGIYTPRAAIWTSERTYLEPNLFYPSNETEARLDPERRTTADLVIEVISPGSAIYDRNTKARYLRRSWGERVVAG